MPRKRKPYVPQSFRELGIRDKVETIDLQSLYSILSYMRMSRGEAEKAMIERYITPTGAKADDFGNYHLSIPKIDGSHSGVLWSAHTDSVAHHDGTQRLFLTTNGVVSLADKQPDADCLGADDGAGVWLLLEMIKARIPGYYIFHREEEIGRKGSRWIVDNYDEKGLKAFKTAIAFDRKMYESIITKQSGTKCCSQEYVDSLAPMFPLLKLKADPTGSYTDTASYVKLIPECTNISVGYTGAHGKNETLDVKHVLMLRDALLYHFDESKLVIKRDPAEEPEWKQYGHRYNGGYGYYDEGDYEGYGTPYYGTGYHKGNYNFQGSYLDVLPLGRVVGAYPYRVAELLVDMGYDAESLMAELFPPDKKEDKSKVINLSDIQKDMEEEAAAALAAIREESDKAAEEEDHIHDQPVEH